jgi:hypothetical protein
MPSRRPARQRMSRERLASSVRDRHGGNPAATSSKSSHARPSVTLPRRLIYWQVRDDATRACRNRRRLQIARSGRGRRGCKSVSAHSIVNCCFFSRRLVQSVRFTCYMIVPPDAFLRVKTRSKTMNTNHQRESAKIYEFPRVRTIGGRRRAPGWPRTSISNCPTRPMPTSEAGITKKPSSRTPSPSRAEALRHPTLLQIRAAGYAT